MSLFVAHQRLAHSSDSGEDPLQPETVQAMQIALHLPKQDPPARSAVLAAAARAVVAACLDERAGADTAYAAALSKWYGHRIRKVARRARNKAWNDAQQVPGVTVDNLARAFAPSAVSEVDPAVAKLQIAGTDLPHDEPGPPLADAPVIYLNADLGMSAGKAAAQAGHGSMLLAAKARFEWVQDWARRDFALSVREVPEEEFAAHARRADAVIVRDAGFTEVAPNTVTVVALPSA